jgi:hypothetical protein
MGLALAVALVLAACTISGDPSAPPPTTAGSGCTEPTTVTLDEGWRFRTDPRDVGVPQQWYGSQVDDTDWQRLAPGKPWESSGLEYDGVAWYRTTITMPTWDTVYLGFGPVDDAATLWLNGERQMTWKAGDEHSEAQALGISNWGEPGDPVTLALRIDDLSGYGGIKGAVRLSDEPRGVMEEEEYIRWLFESHADWPTPDWIQGGPLAWTMSGLPDAGEEALVRSDGAVAPWATAPTVEAWLYDPTAGRVATGTSEITRFTLHEGDLPIPRWEWETLDATVQSVLFADAQERAVRWQVSVRNARDTRRDLVLLLMVRPFGIDRSLAPICKIGLQGDSQVWIDDSPFLVAGTPPADAGVGSLEEAMDAAIQGEVPAADAALSDGSGLGSASLVYPLSLNAGESTTLRFAFPDTPDADSEEDPFPSMEVYTTDQLTETAAAWEGVLDRVQVDVPDEFVEKGVKVSTAYLLLSIDSNGPHPGPLTHDAMWVRDAAHIGLALLQLGHADTVRDYIPDILAAQEPSGRVPPIQGQKVPWDDEEWDAQGQVIFLATQYYRYTGEIAALEEWYPALRAAARFIVELRTAEGDRAEPAGGLLPASKSAEDLGPADQHYYWDNLWAVAGLEEAAYAARELGQLEDAAWMETEAEALRDAILRSVERVMGPDPAFFPGAVEDVESSAMARGTVPALWPVEVLSTESALVRRSFDAYYRRWIAPDDGGFRHRQDQFWPYGGLELAHAYLRLGRQDVLHEILGWTLEHETLPGTYSWAEQVDPQSGGFSGGDMPHAWAAASYATLVREMVISEQEDHLRLFSGVPTWWFEDDRTITLKDAPTHFGALDLHTEGSVRKTEGGWEGTLQLTLSGATPSQGFRWRPPYDARTVEGPSGVTVQDGWLIVPKDGGTVHVTFEPVG